MKQAEKAVHDVEQQLKKLRDQTLKLKKVKDGLAEASGSEEQDQLEELRRQIQSINDDIKECRAEHAKVSLATGA